MDLKRATTLASVTVMTFMLAGGYFVKVNMNIPVDVGSQSSMKMLTWVFNFAEGSSFHILDTLLVLQLSYF